MTSLSDVHKVFNKWLYLSDDTSIDVVLASYLSCQKKGTPIFMFLVDSSGETKTEILRTLYDIYNTYKIVDMTSKAFVSGAERVTDLYKVLKSGEPTVLIIPDVAVLSSKRKDEKNEIWALFRSLYDGDLCKRTGTTVKDTGNAQVTLIGGATKNFRSQYIINNQLGTRELLYSPKQRSKHLTNKLNKASYNDNYEEKMRIELKAVVMEFLDKKQLQLIDVNTEKNMKLNDFLNKIVMKLRILRATANIDYYSGAIVGEIDIETPTRAKKQLKRLAEALLSLDNNYNKKRLTYILNRVVESSGNQLRNEIMDIFNKAQKNLRYTIKEISELTRTHKKLVTIELEMLWKLKWLEKKVVEERIGAYMQHDIIMNKDYLKGGRVVDIPYYWKKDDDDNSIIGGVE